MGRDLVAKTLLDLLGLALLIANLALGTTQRWVNVKFKKCNYIHFDFAKLYVIKAVYMLYLNQC